MRESQQCKRTGGHPAAPATLSGRCSFFRGILPAKVWKLLSHIHMVNWFRDSFFRKTFLFLIASDAGWRGSGSHTSMTEHVMHRVTHTLTITSILSAQHLLSVSFCVSLCVLPFLQPPRVGSQGGGLKKERKQKQKEMSLLCLLSLSCC